MDKHDQAHDAAFTVDRRTAVKWVLAASAALRLPTTAFDVGAASAVAGYGKDPDLSKVYKSGAVWPLTLTGELRSTATVLCDLIIPADDRSPSASSVGVVDFIDEWISAPYPGHLRDRQMIIAGLSWLGAESQRRHGKTFAALTEPQRSAICDDISTEAAVKPDFASAAQFFSRYRSLTAGGFYTTPVGMKDLQYVGNVPQTSFEGPPAAVLKQLGLV